MIVLRMIVLSESRRTMLFKRYSAAGEADMRRPASTGSPGPDQLDTFLRITGAIVIDC
jgi:hypothetical protein